MSLFEESGIHFLLAADGLTHGVVADALGRKIQGYLEKGIQTPVAQGRSTHFDD